MSFTPTIGLEGTERVRRMAARRWGVTIPEVMEEFDTTYWSARRFVMSLIKRGILRRTDERRRRTEVFTKCHGAGGIVYRTSNRGREANEDAVEYFDARWKRKQRRTRRR